jgi:endoglucanase
MRVQSQATPLLLNQSASLLMTCCVSRTLVLALFSIVEPAARADESSRIRLNTVGYLPEQAKIASVLDGEGRFEVVRLSDGVAVREGELSPPTMNADTGERLATANFSSVSAPGKYRLKVDGVGESAAFSVSGNVYREPFYVVTRGMYLWRCGATVSAEHNGHTYQHDACHLEDAYLDFVGGAKGARLASVGGWHDAGDYNKYVVNAGITVGVMLRAWDDFAPQIQAVSLDLPESGDVLPDFLAEVKWELDWLLTMQASDGSVYHKLSTQRFGGFIDPEEESRRRYFVPWSSAATADFVAMMAMASRRYAPYDQAFADRCLQAARKGYDFLLKHPDYRRADQQGFRTGGYETSDGDDRLWAEAELWNATGDDDVRAAAEARLTSDARAAAVDVDWDWGNVKNLGLLTYLASKRPGRDAALVEGLECSLMVAADRIVATTAKHGYARPMGTRYYWGCNGTVARQAVVLEAAYRLTRDKRYRAAQLDALNHLLGRNHYGRSFVTGLGHLPPMHPHDRRSAADDVIEPWPGYLVGGPLRRATDWRDVQDDFRTNEIAINWNAALIYALAAQLPEAPRPAASTGR